MLGLPYEHFCPYEKYWEFLDRQYPDFSALKTQGVCWLGSICMAVNALMSHDGWSLERVVKHVVERYYAPPYNSVDWPGIVREDQASGSKAYGTIQDLRDHDWIPTYRCIDRILRSDQLPIAVGEWALPDDDPTQVRLKMLEMIQGGRTLAFGISIEKIPGHWDGHLMYLGGIDSDDGTYIVSDPNCPGPTSLDCKEFEDMISREPTRYWHARERKEYNTRFGSQICSFWITN